jgi:hypothetical protein
MSSMVVTPIILTKLALCYMKNPTPYHYSTNIDDSLSLQASYDVGSWRWCTILWHMSTHFGIGQRPHANIGNNNAANLEVSEGLKFVFRRDDVVCRTSSPFHQMDGTERWWQYTLPSSLLDKAFLYVWYCEEKGWDVKFDNCGRNLLLLYILLLLEE